jgi:anaerobic selenocysteine-containing dehydrogenase
MLVTIRDGVAVRVRGNPDHPFTRGFLCGKVSHELERVYHADRLKFPMRRVGPKGPGARFERISWSAAADEICRRFREIAASPDGPQAILPYSYAGTMGKLQGWGLASRFFYRLGASLLDQTICATAGVAGYTATIGSTVGTDPESFIRSRYIINWGSNTAVSNLHLWTIMHRARKEHGAKIVTIDPYRSVTAAKSDWHLPIRPGTDAALALGIMHIVVRDGLADDDYLSRYTIGADELRQRVTLEFGPQRVAEITGLAISDIERLAHEYATIKPAAIRINYGLQRHRGGGMAVRTIACLPAFIGAWSQPGGGILLSTSRLHPFNMSALSRPDLVPPGTRTINMVQLAEALNGELPKPPIRALFVYCANPAAVCPDQARVLRGLCRDDLFTVVHEQFVTDTADYADIVLPATTHLEHFDLYGAYGHYYVQAHRPVIEPLGEAKSNNDVFRLLAERLGLERELFQVGDEELCRQALDDPRFNGLTVDELVGRGFVRLNIPQDFAPFANGGFHTPSGKCELRNDRLAADGLDPLAAYTAPAEDPRERPDLAAKYPLQLVSPPSPHFLNSTFVNCSTHRNLAGVPTLQLNTKDADRRGIKTDQQVRVFNDRGSFQAQAAVGTAVPPGVVVAPSIWWNKVTSDGRNANNTTSSGLTDMGGGAVFFDNLVQVEAVGRLSPMEDLAHASVSIVEDLAHASVSICGRSRSRFGLVFHAKRPQKSH